MPAFFDIDPEVSMGTILTLYNLAQDGTGTITLEIAALKAGLSESEFEKKAKEYLEK